MGNITYLGNEGAQFHQLVTLFLFGLINSTLATILEMMLLYSGYCKVYKD